MSLKAAVIGVGAMGRNHARVYADLPGVTLVGVADVDAAQAQAIAERYNTHAFADYRRLLDKQQPDIVSIATPTVDHLPMALEVIARGIHLLIEKPIAYNVAEGEQIIAAAQAAQVTLAVGHIERFNPAVIALKQQLAANTLGRVFQIDARRQGPFPARVKDVGVVIDLAVHDLDVIRYVSGAEVVRIFAETERQIHSEHEDLLTCLLRLSNGAVGTLAVNWLTPTKIRELLVTGEGGMFRVDYLTQDLYFYENAMTSVTDWHLQLLRGVREGRMIRHVVAKREPLLAELETFVAAARGDGAVAVSGEDGLRALQLAQAVVQSGLEHRVVQTFREAV
ncbi:MAG: Gfo/Idh/MocA family oxidoreductase [Ardenticatenales bacterium]|nr:Gfo/Idh/MocA family oxidoreductase [Ardenticatenales bacterium]